MDHRRCRDEIDGGPGRHCAGEPMLGDVRSVEEEEIVGAKALSES
jgi:hypothetical protein